MRINRPAFIELLQEYKQDPNTLRQLLRRIFSFKCNIDLFSQFLFPDAIKGSVPEFHREFYEILFENGNSALAAPRGSAKSTTTGLVFIVFNIVNNLERYIVYVSQNHSKTVQFVDPLRYEFRHNKILNWLYPECVFKSGKDDDGKDREDCFDINNIRVEAVSFEKNLRGFKYRNIRPTLIIGDDIESDERVLNPELRGKDENKLNKVIIPSLDIDGRYKMIGTILHLDSLLMKRIKINKGKIYRACDENFNNILWPERFTRDKLVQIRKEIGDIAFKQEYLNNPIDTSDSIFKREWFEQCKDETVSYGELGSYDKKLAGGDFAFSDRVNADDTVFAGAGIRGDIRYLFNLSVLHGMSISEQMSYLSYKLHTRHNYDDIALEENSIKSISKDIDKYRMPITLFWTGNSDVSRKKPGSKDYDYSGKRHTISKTNMIMRLSVSFENGYWVLPYKTSSDKELTDKLINECMTFALSNGNLIETTVHADIPIALGLINELLDLGTNKVQFFM